MLRALVCTLVIAAATVYLGGVAGDDLEMGRRMRRDQLDGVLSAGTVCQEAAPAFRVLRIPGLLTSRDEAAEGRANNRRVEIIVQPAKQ